MKNGRWDPTEVPTFWVNQASRTLLKHFEQRLRPLDFGMAYLPVVFALAEHGPLLQKQLLEHARVEQPTMAALLARMERDGLVRRDPHPDDRRAAQVSLTEKARELMPQVKARLTEVVAEALADFSEAEKTGLVALLKRIIGNLGESTGNGGGLPPPPQH